MHDEHEHEDPRLDRGLRFDVSTLMSRRRALGMFAGVAGAAFLSACGAKVSSSTGGPTSDRTTSTTTTSNSASSAGSSSVIPTETAGPYPGDGSNGPDVLKESGIVRSDIRSSFGSSTTTASGVPLTVRLKILNNSAGNVAYSGAAVYLWHCNKDGQYSMYGNGIEDENYLRGVQEADSDGHLAFTTIFPAAYSGRWPHIHFEVYSDLATATSSGPIKKTTQLALPEDVCKIVYATSGYEQSVRNLASTSLARDMVFGDDKAATQLASVAGSVAEGYVATLNVPV